MSQFTAISVHDDHDEHREKNNIIGMALGSALFTLLVFICLSAFLPQIAIWLYQDAVSMKIIDKNCIEGLLPVATGSYWQSPFYYYWLFRGYFLLTMFVSFVSMCCLFTVSISHFVKGNMRNNYRVTDEV